MNLTRILELVDRVLRSWWTIVAGVCLGLAVATVALAYIPKTYQAGTTIFIIPQQMPDQLVRSTVTDDMSVRMTALREAVLSRPYMRQLVEEVYGEVSGEEEFDQIRRSISRRVVVDRLRVNPRRGGGVFALEFRDQDPVRAAKVVNTLARLYIEQNVLFRTGQARGITGSVQKLADEAEVELRALEQGIAEFKQRHLYETDDYSSANLSLLQGRQRDQEANRRSLAQAEDHLQTLLLQQDQVDRLVATIPGADQQSVDPITTQLVALRRDLDGLRSRGYTETHPEVRRLQREMNEIVEQNPGLTARSGEEGEEGAGTAMPLTPLETEIDSTRREIERLREGGGRIQNDITLYEGRIARTPRVQAELDKLTKDQELLEEQYREYKEKAGDARAAQSIEEAQQGERFEIIEAAVPPSVPIQPVPAMVYAVGLFGGLALFVGSVLLKPLLAPTVMSQARLGETTDLPVLISVPHLPTAEAERGKRSRIFANITFSILAVGALAATVVVVG